MLTVDFDRLGLRPGERVLDLGCGAGRHTFEMYRRGADVVAFDQDADELSRVRDVFVAMTEAGEVPDGAEADAKEGDALLPAVRRRGVRPGGRRRDPRARAGRHPGARPRPGAAAGRDDRPDRPALAPRGHLLDSSDDYHNTPGGHIRIYSDAELVAKAVNAGLVYDGRHYAHGLHAPYWWIKCAVGVDKDDHPLAKAYHRLLVWDIMKAPRTTRWAEKALNPLIGKSLVVYLHKPLHTPGATDASWLPLRPAGRDVRAGHRGRPGA